MKQFRDNATGAACRGANRRGLTYIELVLATVSAGALMAGMASALFIAGKAFDAGDTTAGRRIRSAEVMGDVLNDLRHATSFSVRTANAVTFTVPDRDGDSIPEVLSYSWSGFPGDPLLYSYNAGTAAPIADDVHNFDLNFVSHFMLAPQPPPIGGSRVLFVAGDENNLTTYETGRQAKLTSWGYEITLITDSDPQSDFDAELANNDVVFVSADASATEVATKLAGITIGIVNENGSLTSQLGFGVGSVSDVRDDIRILTNHHYITTDFSVNQTVKVLTFSQTMNMLDSPASPDVNHLGETLHGTTDAPSLFTLDAGEDLHGGGVSSGRRVQLPWASAASDDLTGEAHALFKRAVEWAAGAGGDPSVGDVLMIVADALNLTSQEQQRKAMLESWGFKVAFVTASDTQANIDAAVALADVCYVHCGITEADLGSKLRHSAIGVVNASNELGDELGLRNNDGDFQNDNKGIDVVEKRHYITQYLPLGNVTIFSEMWDQCKYSGNLGDATVLANVEGSNNPSLATLNTGDAMEGGDSDPAPARRAFLPWGEATFDISDLTSDGRTILKRAIEWAGGAEANIPELLLVVKDSDGLNGDEEDLKAILEGFGYFVTPISDHAPPGEFDTAIAASDVIYVVDTIDSLVLGSKVTSAPVGVVSEEPEVSELGFADSFTSDDNISIEITDTSHYITEVFVSGQLDIFTGNEPITYLDGAEAAGRQTLGRHLTLGGDKALVAIAAGNTLVGGGPAAGRRVKLPWGNGYDNGEFTEDGMTVFERSIAWALGLGDDGTPDSPDVNLGYEPIFASEESGLDNFQVAMQITLPENGIFTSLSGYFYDKDKKVRYAIYSDNSGEPGNLITESELYGPGGNGPQWTTVDVPPVQLSSGTYWISFFMDGTNVKYYHEADAGQQVRYKDYNAGSGFISSWGTSDASYTRRISFYATYLPTN